MTIALSIILFALLSVLSIYSGRYFTRYSSAVANDMGSEISKERKGPVDDAGMTGFDRERPLGRSSWELSNCIHRHSPFGSHRSHPTRGNGGCIDPIHNLAQPHRNRPVRVLALRNEALLQTEPRSVRPNPSFKRTCLRQAA